MAGPGLPPPPAVRTGTSTPTTPPDDQNPRDDHVITGCFDGVATRLGNLAAAGAGTPKHLSEHFSAFAGMHHLSRWRSGDIGGFSGRRRHDTAHADDHFAEVRAPIPP